MSCVKSLLTKKAHDQRRLEKAIRNTSSAAAAAAGAAAGNGRAMGGDEVEVMEVERTELEIATEAAVVRAKSTGRQARKELRQSMSRYSTMRTLRRLHQAEPSESRAVAG